MELKLEDMDKSNLIIIVKNIRTNLGEGKILTKMILKKTKDGHENEFHWKDVQVSDGEVKT